MRIMLIDDDAFPLFMLEQQLALLGRRNVVAFQESVAAVEALRQRSSDFDLIFCDLQMPHIDGVQVVKHLAELHYGGALVLSSSEDARVLQTVRKLAEAYGIRVLGALAKPIAMDRLAELLQLATQANSPVHQASPVQIDAQELREGLTRGELVNFYQPKVDLRTGALVGVEALVRWRHPTRGLVYPDSFIGLAEDEGLIGALTHVVLQNALLQQRRWKDDGLALHIAVNVSMGDLAALSFPETVARLADAAGVPLTSLVLEVTESRLMKDACATLDILTRLRLKGIGLSIDDFGTGHSSFAQLRDLPFDELKVDRSFVHDATADASVRAIVEGTLAMSRHMRMRSVAEGIEDLEDWRLMQSLGCDVAQGYFIGRPMDAADIEDWHRDWRRRGLSLTLPAP